MADWYIAMLCLAPLLLLSSYSGSGLRGWWHGTEPKVRAWGAMLLASLATVALQPVQGSVPFTAYLCLDTLAGMAVMARPSGIFSRAIGVGFVAMILLDAGAFLTDHPGTGAYQSAMVFLGWAMWAILLFWSSCDAGKALNIYFSNGSGAASFGHGDCATRSGSTGVIEP
mgnify:FL=1